MKICSNLTQPQIELYIGINISNTYSEKISEGPWKDTSRQKTQMDVSTVGTANNRFFSFGTKFVSCDIL